MQSNIDKFCNFLFYFLMWIFIIVSCSFVIMAFLSWNDTLSKIILNFLSSAEEFLTKHKIILKIVNMTYYGGGAAFILFLLGKLLDVLIYVINFIERK